MNNVCRYQILKPINCNWDTFGKVLRIAQSETRTLMNKAIQLCWEWDNFCSDYKEKNSVYPKPEQIFEFKTLGSPVFNLPRENTIASFKRNTPIILHKDNVKIYNEKDTYIAILTLVNIKGEKENSLKLEQFAVLLDVDKNYSRYMIDGCVTGAYGISSSQILRDGRTWYLELSYSLKPQQQQLCPCKSGYIDSAKRENQ